MKRKNHALPFLFAKKEDKENAWSRMPMLIWNMQKRTKGGIFFMAALYETWTFQEELPDLFQKLIHDLGRTKTSTKVSDCSQYNSLRAKSATLHAPTLRAILWLSGVFAGAETEGALGRQFGEGNTTNYYCMECKNGESHYALIYNWRNGKFKGCVQKADTVSVLPSIQEEQNIAERYIALLAFASTCYGTELYDMEFTQHFEKIMQILDMNEEIDEEEFLSSAYICCDNLYRRGWNPVFH